VGFIVVSVIVAITGGVVALASLSRTGLRLDLAFMVVVAVVITVVGIGARRRPGLLVPPSLQGLDPDSRVMVSRAVNTGARADRPELARAVVTQARRKQVATALFLAIWALVVLARAAALASGESGGAKAIDVLVILGSLLAAAAAVPSFLRARRAMSANDPHPG
jgi:hypothetical protein